MFSQASDCPGWGPFVSNTHDALGHGTYPLKTRYMEPGYLSPFTPSLLVASSGHHWRPVQTCSLEDLYPTGTDT